jgi:hypothetical protein
LAKFWISFKLHVIDPNFHGDHEYLVNFDGSLMVKALSLTSGILPENLHIKLASELCSLYCSQDRMLGFSEQKCAFQVL